MTCYWLRVERLLTLVNKMETFGRWTTFRAESQHDLVWSGQGQGFSCKNTIRQTLKYVRVACGGKCATTNCSLKVAYMTNGLITLISLQGKGWREQVRNNGPKTDGYPKKYSSCLQHAHRCSGENPQPKGWLTLELNYELFQNQSVLLQSCIQKRKQSADIDDNWTLQLSLEG